MKKYICSAIILFLLCLTHANAQTLNEAKELYLAGEYEKALPVFKTEYEKKPTDASLNQWYGVCLYETGGDINKAEEYLLVASKKKIRDSFFYLGRIYTWQYRIEEAEQMFATYRSMLKKKGDEAASEKLEEKEKDLARIRRMVNNTEDIQIIDSVVVPKEEFLDAYLLTPSSGSLDYFNKVFQANIKVESVVYSNEKGTKIYFAQPDTSKHYRLYSMEKLLDNYGNEKILSRTNFGLDGGNTNYPFILTDGITIYFSAEDKESLGGYDLFVSRYNMNNDTYLTPERLNMPFNSPYNDYLMVIDEEKGIGWFASDRFQEEGDVCVYTFIPNPTTKMVDSEDSRYLASRAMISSIKDTWGEGKSYSDELALARKVPEVKQRVKRDFEFVINDNHTYYTLSDFSNDATRDMYFSVIQKHSEMNELAKTVDNQRMEYHAANADDKRVLFNSIFINERRLEQLQQEIAALELQTRNEEIKALKEAKF
ncbi:M48 family metallopeptidase [Dysgonomonas sp. 25]|uniref:tetratricopeptide repeat protein n=1 Tax=Dysgonomonas sp. 25 TaxID=2302933 RepID=UPI0013D3D943|nr:tetratricopeptide repeat protein [Dysgonomonas sp. 25]NDV68664.1 tetratricopeptide repeat protein [Dysgonomonas sp. 25]